MIEIVYDEANEMMRSSDRVKYELPRIYDRWEMPQEITRYM